jgi:hypothetical protein
MVGGDRLMNDEPRPHSRRARKIEGAKPVTTPESAEQGESLASASCFHADVDSTTDVLVERVQAGRPSHDVRPRRWNLTLPITSRQSKMESLARRRSRQEYAMCASGVATG